MPKFKQRTRHIRMDLRFYAFPGWFLFFHVSFWEKGKIDWDPCQATVDSGVASIIGGANIHIFVSTADFKNNWFQKNLMMQNTILSMLTTRLTVDESLIASFVNCCALVKREQVLPESWWELTSESLHESFLNSCVPILREQELHESWQARVRTVSTLVSRKQNHKSIS
jgi:hypothetical protein